MKLSKKSIQIDDKKYCYWEKNRQKNKVLIFLHGFPGNHSYLAQLANNFSDWRIIIPDLPACGQSDELGKKSTLSNYTDWLNKFIVQLGIESITIIGYSFGSRLGLLFNKLKPHKVKALILLAPVTKAEGVVAQFISWKYKAAGFLPENKRKLKLADDLYKKIATTAVFKTSTGKRRKKLSALTAKEMNRVSPQVSVELFRDFKDSNLLLPAKKITTDCLIIAGDKDELAPLSTAKELSEALLKSELKILKNSGHMFPLEQPATTAKIIKDWLKKIKS